MASHMGMRASPHNQSRHQRNKDSHHKRQGRKSEVNILLRESRRQDGNHQQGKSQSRIYRRRSPATHRSATAYRQNNSGKGNQQYAENEVCNNKCFILFHSTLRFLFFTERLQKPASGRQSSRSHLQGRSTGEWYRHECPPTFALRAEVRYASLSRG